MSQELIQRVVRTLDTASPRSATAVDRALIDAAFLLEKSRGLHHAAWPEHVQSADVTTENAQSLTRAVAVYVRRFARGTWALGKSADPAQRRTLAQALRRNLAPDGDAFELYQALVALGGCGEPDVFGGATCRSVIHIDANRQYAQRILDREGSQTPGDTGKPCGFPVAAVARTVPKNSPASAGNSPVHAPLMSP
jgi:hypothetical protein